MFVTIDLNLHARWSSSLQLHISGETSLVLKTAYLMY